MSFDYILKQQTSGSDTRLLSINVRNAYSFVKTKYEKKMESIALTIHNDKIKEEIFDFLKRFSTDELEFVSIEDIGDLKLLQETRHEETVSFADYLKNAD